MILKLLFITSTLAGSPGRAKSTFKYAHPLKMFVLMYKMILIKEIFHFEGEYYPSQHSPLFALFTPLALRYSQFQIYHIFFTL